MAGTAHLISINMMGSTTTRHTATGTATTSITGITAPMDGVKTVGESSTMDPTRAMHPKGITTMNQQRMAWGDFLIPCFVREPHCHDVPRLCPGSGGAPETGLPERLETETRPVLRLQRAQGLPPAMAASAARQRNNSGLGQYQLFEDRRRTGPLLRFLLMSSHEAHIRASPVKDKCSGDASGTDPEAASL